MALCAEGNVRRSGISAADTERQPPLLGHRRQNFWQLWRRARAQHALEQLQRLNRRQPVGPSYIVTAYLAVGDKNKALAALENAYAHHSNLMVYLKVEPAFDPLRTDPRFQDLLHRVGLDR